MTQTFRRELTQFLASELSIAASKPIRNGARIRFTLNGQSLVAQRAQKTWEVVDTSDAWDFGLILTDAAWSDLYSNPRPSVGETGVQVIDWLVHPKESDRIRLKLNCGMTTLLRRGYLGVIPLGGATFAQALAKRGLGSARGIKAAISRLRGNP